MVISSSFLFCWKIQFWHYFVDFLDQNEIITILKTQLDEKENKNQQLMNEMEILSQTNQNNENRADKLQRKNSNLKLKVKRSISQRRILGAEDSGRGRARTINHDQFPDLKLQKMEKKCKKYKSKLTDAENELDMKDQEILELRQRLEDIEGLFSQGGRQFLEESQKQDKSLSFNALEGLSSNSDQKR